MDKHPLWLEAFALQAAKFTAACSVWRGLFGLICYDTLLTAGLVAVAGADMLLPAEESEASGGRACWHAEVVLLLAGGALRGAPSISRSCPYEYGHLIGVWCLFLAGRGREKGLEQHCCGL
jgi:hypothetical protein